MKLISSSSNRIPVLLSRTWPFPAVSRREVWKVEPAEFCATPFVGERLRFRTKKTFLRGHEAFDRETGVHTRAPVMRVECPAKS